MRTPARCAAAALMLLVGVGATGCAHESPTEKPSESVTPVEAAPVEPSDEESTSKDDATPLATIDPKELKPGDLNKTQLHAVAQYLTVRENSESAAYKDGSDWAKDLKDVTTADGFKDASKQFGRPDSSGARNIAQEQGYVVQVATGGCILTPDFPNDKTTVAVQCDLTDLVVDKGGDTVPSSSVDTAWPYYGTREGPVLVLAKKGDKWLLDGDYTGEAS